MIGLSIDRPVVSSVLVPVARDLASEFFRESGDLPVEKFPATIEVAHIVGRLLGFDRVDRVKITLETFAKAKSRARSR